MISKSYFLNLPFISFQVCVDNMSKTVSKDEIPKVLNTLGKNMCNMLEYQDLKDIQLTVDTDDDPEIQYVAMVGQLSDENSFINVPCPTRKVVQIQCQGLECGRRPAHVKSKQLGRRGLTKPVKALHGDWPWHVALMRDGNHVCDGTLIDQRWIMTTASCFQG